MKAVDLTALTVPALTVPTIKGEIVMTAMFSKDVEKLTAAAYDAMEDCDQKIMAAKLAVQKVRITIAAMRAALNASGK